MRPFMASRRCGTCDDIAAMKVLLTGASSFTGYWFAEALHRAGHHVVAPLRQPRALYCDGARAERVRRLATIADIIDDAPFGSDRFLDLCHNAHDVLCHHAARVTGYREPDFDAAAALAENTANLVPVLQRLASGGLQATVVTGSVFEPGEGDGSPHLAAFSTYGLSKAFTAQLVAHRCREIGVRCAKFVIPNPFGPLEEPRFGNYLLRTWKAGGTARVATPAYVRDNIHVDLLAAAYARFVLEAAAGSRSRLNPSGYAESQGRFAGRFAAAMRPRLGLACAVECAEQTLFPEPLIRVNTEPATAYVGGWCEDAAWDAIAAFA